MILNAGFKGPVWRLLPVALADTPKVPAQAPQGRFHHSGQIAAYASLSAEGAAVAIRRYLDDGHERMLVPMWLDVAKMADMRGNASASMIWQNVWEVENSSPTWAFSDDARKAGVQAMLYSSRSRPHLSHVVVFAPECLTWVGPATAFKPTSH